MNSILFRAFAWAIGAGMLPLQSAAAADNTVFIATWRGCEEACQGFQDYLKEQGVDAEFVIRDADTDSTKISAIYEEAKTLAPDLLVTWGTTVTRQIAGTLDDLENPVFNHDIPQLFMIVADPVGSGIVKSLEETGRANLTGTFNRMPETVTIETIRSYMPEFDHLGLIYNSDERNAVLKQAELSALSEQMGFSFTAIEIASESDGTPIPDDIPRRMAELKEAGVDFVYVGSSSFLRKNSSILRDASLQQSLPVLSPYEEMVHDGNALISVAARYYDVGRLAGDQALRILMESASPGELPVARMTDFAVTINLEVARRLKQYPPIGLLQIAETVN